MFQSLYSQYDEYGFSRPPDFDEKSYNTFMSSYLPVLVRRGQRWEELLEHHDVAKGGRKIKRFVRKGVPRVHRAKVRENMVMGISRCWDYGICW